MEAWGLLLGVAAGSAGAYAFEIFDFDGFDLVLPRYGLSDAQCLAQCEAHAGCRLAVHKPQDGKCSLKSIVLEPTFDLRFGTIGGSVLITDLPPNMTFLRDVTALAGTGGPSVTNLLPRQTYRGLPLDYLCTLQRSIGNGSLVLASLPGISPELCARECMAVDSCTAFEHALGGGPSNAMPSCTLLSGPIPSASQPVHAPAISHACLRLSTQWDPRLTLTGVTDISATGAIGATGECLHGMPTTSRVPPYPPTHPQAKPPMTLEVYRPPPTHYV